MSSILEHPSVAGSLNHVSGASGGEHSGPCPWCGGDDRFRCWPDHPSGATGGRFLCRGCGRQGDGIAFLMELEGAGYVEACKRLGATPKDRTRQGGRDVRTCPVWTPKPSASPDAAWMTAAGRFVDYAVGRMAASDAGRAYAASRGLTPATVAAQRIGGNPSTIYHDRAAWGLPEDVNDKTGKPRKVWLPAGLVIPTMRDGVVVAVKIRRGDWTPEDELPKYAAVTGSAKSPMVLAPGKGKPCVVVESELDAILCAQEARDLVTAVAMKTAKGKPDVEAHAILLAAPVILVALDADRAGSEGWPWWRATYRQAKRWPVPGDAKDVGDCAAAPGLIRAWIEAGLPEPVAVAEPKVDLMPVPEPSPVAGPVLYRADDLAHGKPCTTSEAALAAYRVSDPHLICCPATTPPWNWRYTIDCTKRCPTPCELKATN